MKKQDINNSYLFVCLSMIFVVCLILFNKLLVVGKYSIIAGTIIFPGYEKKE